MCLRLSVLLEFPGFLRSTETYSSAWEMGCKQAKPIFKGIFSGFLRLAHKIAFPLGFASVFPGNSPAFLPGRAGWCPGRG